MYLGLSTLNDQHQIYSLKKKVLNVKEKVFWTSRQKEHKTYKKKKYILDIASNAL